MSEASSLVDVSLVILTYNRERCFIRQVPIIRELSSMGVEISVVDNFSDNDYCTRLLEGIDCRIIRLDKNYGAVARNIGISESSRKFCVTIDDDVYGLKPSEIVAAVRFMNSDSSVAAVCFKVVDEKSKSIVNWCHPYSKELFSDSSFYTYQISEGAVMFDRNCVVSNHALCPLPYFISHEGLYAALKLYGAGKKVAYFPGVTVLHETAEEARESWRRYYYDTRNMIWLSFEQYRMKMILSLTIPHLIAMMLYSVRDSYFSYYCKGIKDGVLGVRKNGLERFPVSSRVYHQVKEMRNNRPSFWKRFKERFIRKGIRV